MKDLKKKTKYKLFYLFRLTALFPVNLGNGTLNEHGHSAFTVRVGDQKVTWIENQVDI